MKKITIAILACAFLPFVTMAQTSKEEKVEKEEQVEKKQTQEIIIRQKGDKDIKLKVEIDGDKVTVNGKPLSEFKDKDVTINKRKMTITDGNGDNVMSWNFSDDGKDWNKLGEAFGQSFGKQWQTEHDSKGAFLGVTTETKEDGVEIEKVVKESAAEKAGLKTGDIITKVGEEKITSPEILSDVIGFKKPKDEVKITYKRNGKESNVKAILGQRKPAKVFSYGNRNPNVRSFSMPRIAPNMEGLGEDDMPEIYAPDGSGYNMLYPRQKKLGLKIQDTEEGNGVKIINVEDSSAAATAGIKKDDIVTEINGKKIENTDDAREELTPDEEKKSYKIKVNRGGTEMNFDVKIPRKLKTANL